MILDIFLFDFLFMQKYLVDIFSLPIFTDIIAIINKTLASKI